MLEISVLRIIASYLINFMHNVRSNIQGNYQYIVYTSTIQKTEWNVIIIKSVG